MKAITICEPYATLIARGDKRVENRRWQTRYRGPLAIHAGKSEKYLAASECRTFDERYTISINEMGFGNVIAVANLVACVPIDEVYAGKFDSLFPWLRLHEHVEGPFCWIFAHTVRLPGMLSASGKQGLWNWEPPEGVAAYVRRQMPIWLPTT